MKKAFLGIMMAVITAASVGAASLHLTDPNGGESLVLGTPFTITWTSSGVAGPLRLVLLRDDVIVGVIADNLSATATSYAWTVGSTAGGSVAAGVTYKVRVRLKGGALHDDSDGVFSIVGGYFSLTAPDGGETWPLESTRQITWAVGDVTGSIRLDLYRNGTALENKVGTIITNTPAAAGKYSWKVGEYIGGTASNGGGYRIVIRSYTPPLEDASTGPFTIAPAQIKLTPKPTKYLSLTNPRRADVWYKGTGYTITWASPGLVGSMVRLDLLKNDGTTLVLPIAENIINDGQHFWAVPLSLPDVETLYKMRIRTMDGQYSDTVGPFKITKAKAAAGPPAITIIAPVGPAQVSTGTVYPIRWKSTCSTAAEGPTHDGFDIHLMNAEGTKNVAMLLNNSAAVYDGGNPDGSHSWHWDWKTFDNPGPGTYCVGVTSLSGHCTGIGAPFQLVQPQKLYNYVCTPVAQNCVVVYKDTAAPSLGGPAGGSQYQCAGGLARVGYRFFINKKKGIIQEFGLHSKLKLPDPYWYKDKGHLIRAKMTIKRKSQMQASNIPSGGPCLGGVVILDSDFPCYGMTESNHLIPGTSFVLSNSPGPVWEVDVTSGYLPLFQQNKPDYGMILFPAIVSYDYPYDYTGIQDCECYIVTLTFRFAKDVGD